MLPFMRRNKIKNLRTQADQARDRKEWKNAAQFYKQVLDHSPELPSIWVQYGHALKEQGLLTEAEQAYRHALMLDEENADTYLQLGHVLKLQGFKEEALESYLRGFELDENSQNLKSEIRSFSVSDEDKCSARVDD
ncbi:MAG: tetratricopeptide repeat protein, partial [Gluconobacter japonicus]